MTTRLPFINSCKPAPSLFLKICLILLSLTISILYAAPFLLQLHELQWDYRDVIFFMPLSYEITDAHHYITQIKEIMEGNTQLTNGYLAEYKNTGKSLWPRFPYFLVAYIGKILHLMVQDTIFLLNVILPPLIFFLAYRFLVLVTQAPWVSMFGACVLTLTPHLARFEVLFSLVIRLLAVGPPVLSEAHCYHCFARPINPQVTYLFLLACLVCFLKALATRKLKYVFLTVGWGIMLSYSYVYFSTYLYVFLGIFAVGTLFLRIWQPFQTALLALGLILLGAAPFWYSVFSFSGNTLTQMAWMSRDRAPVIDPQQIVILLVCGGIIGGMLKGKIRSHPGLTAFAVLISGVICMNQHVITGINVQPGWHYNAFVIPQSMILAETILIAEWLQHGGFRSCSRWHWWRHFFTRTGVIYGGLGIGMLSLCIHPTLVATFLSADGQLTPQFHTTLLLLHYTVLALGVVLVSMGLLLKSRLRPVCLYAITYMQNAFARLFYRQSHLLLLKVIYTLTLLAIIGDVGLVQYVHYYQDTKPELGYIQSLSPALHWLNDHTPPESVVAVNIDYVSTDTITIYTHNNVYLASHAQYYTVPPLSELRDRLYNLMNFMGIRQEQDFEQLLSSKKVFMYHLHASFAEYQAKLKNDVYPELKKYRVDYLFYGPREKANFKVDPGTAYPFLQKVYDDGSVSIYKIT